ncbi:MAG: B12-binding domain-containing radical SAM protein, partial [Candidatus Omnitrophica bacterium]|nr:B12-binding domain-containing radical SAM protein [Candidatus Omnitrophota bacterium]
MLSDEILLGTRKPGQYIGQEWNVSRKDFDKAGIRFALCFPDLYEVGMSNIGIRVVYDVLNRIDDVACERVFSPDKDMEEVLRSRNLPLSALESGRGLKEFDMLGFSLGYELLYTNVLNILDLAGIPFASSERGAKFPLIIGGGPCVLNPEPIAEFFDLFVIGEAEEGVLEVMDVYRNLKNKYRNGELLKDDLLIALAQIEGVYVPSLY